MNCHYRICMMQSTLAHSWAYIKNYHITPYTSISTRFTHASPPFLDDAAIVSAVRIRSSTYCWIDRQ